MNNRYTTFSLILLFAILLAGIPWRHLGSKLVENLFTKKMFHVLASEPEQHDQITSSLESSDSQTLCQKKWLDPLVAYAYKPENKQDALWKDVLLCSPTHLPIFIHKAPDDLDLAHLAVKAYPNQSEAWFWLGSIYSSETPEIAIVQYQQGLQLDPQDGLRWRELGDLYRQLEKFEPALNAYLQSCLNGDPGKNGCWLAGKLVEKNGDIELAIQYYRLSDWDKALERADALERQLKK